MMFRRLLRWWPVPALIALLIYPWVYRAPYYHVLGFNVMLFATMATSWNIMAGYTGYKSLGHSAFFGLGAYLVAIAAARLGWNPLWSAPLLALVVAMVALILGQQRLEGPAGTLLNDPRVARLYLGGTLTS